MRNDANATETHRKAHSHNRLSDARIIHRPAADAAPNEAGNVRGLMLCRPCPEVHVTEVAAAAGEEAGQVQGPANTAGLDLPGKYKDASTCVLSQPTLMR